MKGHKENRNLIPDLEKDSIMLFKFCPSGAFALKQQSMGMLQVTVNVSKTKAGFMKRCWRRKIEKLGQDGKIWNQGLASTEQVWRSKASLTSQTMG